MYNCFERAKRDRAGKNFINDVRNLVPYDEVDMQILNSFGFQSLRELIESPEGGLQLEESPFVNLAFAFKCYDHVGCDVIKYLVTQEGWVELLKFVPVDYKVKCGEGLKKHGKPPKGDNVTFKEDRGNSKAYTLKRLARDSETDDAVAEVYAAVKAKKLSANKAAIKLGWRVETTTIRKDVESAARTIKGFFNAEEIEKLKRLL